MNIGRISTGLLTCGLLLASAAQQATAQPGRGHGAAARGAAGRRQEPDISQLRNRCSELDLTEEQAAALQALRQDMREQMRALRETGVRPSREGAAEMQAVRRARLENILTEEQLAQLEQRRQEARDQALRVRTERIEQKRQQHHFPGRPERSSLAAYLDLTEEQREQLQALRQEMRETMQQQRASGQRPTREQMEAIQAARRERLQSILTPEQLSMLEARRADMQERRGGMMRLRSGLRADTEEVDGAARPAASGTRESTWGEIKNQMK